MTAKPTEWGRATPAAAPRRDDGNERTGFVIGILFLELIGARFTAIEEFATQAVLALAAGTLGEAG